MTSLLKLKLNPSLDEEYRARLNKIWERATQTDEAAEAYKSALKQFRLAHPEFLHPNLARGLNINAPGLYPILVPWLETRMHQFYEESERNARINSGNEEYEEALAAQESMKHV